MKLQVLVLYLAICGASCASQPEKDRVINFTQRARTPLLGVPYAASPAVLHGLEDLPGQPVIEKFQQAGHQQESSEPAASWETAAQNLIELIDQATTQSELDHLEEQFIQLLPGNDHTHDREMDLLHNFHEAKMAQEDILQETTAPIAKKVLVQGPPSPPPFVLPPQARIFNHIYGQHDIANVTDRHRYSTSCAAMALSAAVILGSKLGKAANIDTLAETYKAQLMQDILSAGAAAYDETPDKDTDNFVLADTVVPFLMSRQQDLNFRISEDLTVTYASQIHALASSSSYTPDLPLRTLLDLIRQNTQSHEEIIATGVVLSDGTRSNTVLYIRGDQPENARFVLYDSHRCSHLAPTPAIQTKASKTAGSFLSWAPDIDTIISIAHADGRWPATIASTDTYANLGSLRSPVFIDILQPQS